MTQTGGLVVRYAWPIFAALLAILGWLLLRHEQDPLQDLSQPGPDGIPVGPKAASVSPPAEQDSATIGYPFTSSAGPGVHDENVSKPT